MRFSTKSSENWIQTGQNVTTFCSSEAWNTTDSQWSCAQIGSHCQQLVCIRGMEYNTQPVELCSDWFSLSAVGVHVLFVSGSV